MKRENNLNHLTNNPLYLLFVIFIIMPINGLLISVGGGTSIFGIALILMQIPKMVQLVYGKLR